MLYRITPLETLRKDFEVIVESVTDDPIDFQATIRFSSHSGVEIASGFLVDISVSSRDGEARYTCTPAFWGSKLPELIPAFHEVIEEHRARVGS
jgi:hypothetical protein